MYGNRDERVMFLWLTMAKMEEYYPMNIGIIRQLIQWRIGEIRAKNALLISYQLGEYGDAQQIHRNLMTDYYGDVSNTELMAEIQHWPQLRHIDEVRRLGKLT